MVGTWIEYVQSNWRDLNMTNLKVDEAFINIKSDFTKLFLYTLSEECFMCPYTRMKEIHPKKNNIFIQDTSRAVSLKIFEEDVGIYALSNETALCKLSPNLGEFGVYNLTIHPNKTCSFVTDKEPVNIYLSMVLVIIFVAIFSALFPIKKYIRKRIHRNIGNNDNELQQPETSKKRLRSLDVFRGFSIVLMIFVNSGGGAYWWIDHAPWNGLHLADIVFPSFLWIMGVCIPISIKSQLNRDISKRTIFEHILWRSIKLFLIGLCLNSINGPKLEDLRIMGVLQRFGIAYLVCASLHMIFSKPNIILPQGKIQRAFYDIILMKFQWICTMILIIINLGFIYGLKVPGCPRGYMGPGGKHEMAEHKNCIGGAIGYIDDKILTMKHIYQHPTAKYIYDSQAFDPEGIFGCLLTIVQVMIGVQCGVTLIIFNQWQSRLKRWLSWGLILGLIGGVLCNFTKETGWIPVNKNLWSLSFVCATSSIAFFLLTFCYFIIDVKSYWNGTPFLHSGMNAIIMYVGHTVLHKILPWHWRIGLMNTHFMLLLECTWNTILWIGISVYLYSKNIFYSL